MVETRKQVLQAIVLLMAVILLGTAGYYAMSFASNLSWSLLDCLYMTSITITGVGFSEVIEVVRHPWGRPFTLLLVLFGMAAHVYFISTLAAFILEGHLTRLVERRRMQKVLSRLSGHYIVCGAGETGLHVISELVATRCAVVVIDSNPEHLQHASSLSPTACLEGDATRPQLLEEAGIQRAKGLAATLAEDRDNVYLILTARQLNPHLRIVAKAVDPAAQDKLRLVGADSVVAPNYIGGLRIASELIRPTVVSFLDRMLRDPRQALRVFEVTLPPESPLVGRTLATSHIYPRTGLLILAIGRGEDFLYNPPASTTLQAGDVLIALGTPEQHQALQEYVAQTT